MAIARHFTRSAALAIVAAVLSGVIVRLAVAPLAEHCAAILNVAFRVAQPKVLHQLPYSPGMLVVIYLTFLEPTVAALIMAKLAWHGLPGDRAIKTGLFTLLVLGASGRLTLFFVNSFWVQQPLGIAFLSTGQFVAEMALMAALVGWFSSRPKAAGPKLYTAK